MKYLILGGFSYKKASTELEEAQHWDSVEALCKENWKQHSLSLRAFITAVGRPVNA